jgi:hypothetical protein
MAAKIVTMLGGMTSSLDPVAETRLHDRICRVNTIASEAARKRRSYMSDTPDPEPLARAAVHQPRPRHHRPFTAHATARTGAQPAHRCNGGAGRGVRRDHAGARRGGLRVLREAMGGLRREGLTRHLGDGDVERVVGL